VSGTVAASAGVADLGVGDLVVEFGVELGGLGGCLAQAAAYGLDGDTGVDEREAPGAREFAAGSVF
jgi:hypothetical protein